MSGRPASTEAPRGRRGRRGRGRAALLLAAALGSAGCWKTIPAGISGSVDIAAGASDVVHFVYLGSGGWIIERGDDQVMAAPLFSNPGLVRTGLHTIRSDTVLVDRYMSRYDVSAAKVILVGHAHYDHLMDVPRTALRHAPRARIVGSLTTANTLGTWSGVGDRVDVVNDSAGDQRSLGRWLHYGEGVRVMALRSKHAPHFDGYTLYQGTRDRPLEREPTLATEWLEGRTFAFLVDFMESADSVAFRVYYSDAVSPAPAGFATESLIAERAVDVAILVPSTFDQVDWHPEAFIENLRPKRVLLGHWENFFAPIDDETESIRFSDIGHFEDRLRAVFEGEWWRPDLWTEFTFPVG